MHRSPDTGSNVPDPVFRFTSGWVVCGFINLRHLVLLFDNIFSIRYEDKTVYVVVFSDRPF